MLCMMHCLLLVVCLCVVRCALCVAGCLLCVLAVECGLLFAVV